MEGTIHIISKYEMEYWIEGALVDKVTKGGYDPQKMRCDAYVHYKNKRIETIQGVIKIEVLGTYNLEAKPIPTKEEKLQPDNEKLNTKLVECNLSVRSVNILHACGIETIGDLVKLHETDIRKLRNAGPKTIIELNDFMTLQGLEWAE